MAPLEVLTAPALLEVLVLMMVQIKFFQEISFSGAMAVHLSLDQKGTTCYWFKSISSM